MEYLNIFLEAYKNYASYLWYEISHPTWHNYFYWLLGVSGFFFALEWIAPWRADQPKFRKDFWLDFFYMFFNFFLFSLIIYNAASDVVVHLFNEAILSFTGFNLQAANPLRTSPMWFILLVGFVVRDFVQWWTHRLLHRVPWLWNFHQVHHSVKQMGFAAHLRYHWMETVVYRTIEYIPLALLGIGLYDFFVIHIFTLAVGHYNHSNFTVPKWFTGGVVGLLLGVVCVMAYFDVHFLKDYALGWKIAFLVSAVMSGIFILGPLMKYLFNSPEMHIWHHAYNLPEERRYGVNFGLTLAIWDYLFGTAYIPQDGRDIQLGYPGVEKMPETFLGQIFYGFRNKDVG